MWPSSLLLLLGCPLELEEKAPFDCELGTPGPAGFAPADGADVELIAGFQGLLFAELLLRADPSAPDPVAIVTSFETDGEEPTGGWSVDVPLRRDGEGTRTSEVFVLHLGATASHWEGRTGRLAVRAEDRRHQCVATAEITLVDDDPCLHTDGEPYCPEGAE